MSVVTNLYERRTLAAAVAAEVRAQAGRRGLLQKDVRELLGLQKAGASARWNGRMAFRLEEIGILCEAWGIEPADLMPREWCAVRDLNPEPAGSASPQVVADILHFDPGRVVRRPDERRKARTQSRPGTRWIESRTNTPVDHELISIGRHARHDAS